MQVVKSRFVPAANWEYNSERYLQLSGVAFPLLMFNWPINWMLSKAWLFVPYCSLL